MKLIEMSDNQRSEVKKAELLILKELNRICQKHNIKYMLCYGSLIGAIRHGGYIPWDDDLDVCMLRKDYIRFKEICKSELKDDFFYQCQETDPEYFHLLDKIRLNGTVFRESFLSKYKIHHGIYLDIFPVDYIPDNKLLRIIQYYKLHFYRTGLMAKYLMLGARKGKKKILFAFLRGLYFFFPIKYLYKKAQETAMKYDDKPRKKATCFFGAYHKKDTFDANVYEDLEQHTFENIMIWIPKEYDVYLRTIYGDYTKLPPKEQQNTNHTLTELKLK